MVDIEVWASDVALPQDTATRVAQNTQQFLADAIHDELVRIRWGNDTSTLGHEVSVQA